MPAKLTQDSLLRALLLLRKTHPDLPEITWEISRFAGFGLRGSSFSGDDDRHLLGQYAHALGGRIALAHQYSDPNLGRRQSLVLRARFAEVPIEIRGAMPVEVDLDVEVAA